LKSTEFNKKSSFYKGKNKEYEIEFDNYGDEEETDNTFITLKNFCCPEIMIVDDIDYNRFALNEIMSMLNLDCLEAING
jgi:hypothetical protein